MNLTPYTSRLHRHHHLVRCISGLLSGRRPSEMMMVQIVPWGHSHTHTLTLALTHSNTQLTHLHTHSTLAHIHTHTHTHTRTHTHSLTHTHSHSHSLTHTNAVEFGCTSCGLGNAVAAATAEGCSGWGWSSSVESGRRRAGRSSNASFSARGPRWRRCASAACSPPRPSPLS